MTNILILSFAVVAFGLFLVQSHRLRTRERQIAATFGGMAKQEKLAMLGHMLTGIAHELHTPLGAVSCALDTRKRAAAKLAEALAEIENGSDAAAAADRAGRALEIIRSTDPVLDEAIGRTRELLAELKSAGRGERTEPVPVNVNALIDGALLLLRHELKQETEVVTEYGDLPEIPGFPGGMGQIFLNLILNASQAMTGPGTLTVTSAVEGDRAIVRVRDSGPGLPPGCAENLFRAGWTSKPEGEGTGLGLFISQKIADRHGGVISARNHPDGGAEFTVNLPLTGPVATAGA